MEENSKLLTILTEVDEGTKTPFKAHNEILFLFGVVTRLPTTNEAKLKLKQAGGNTFKDINNLKSGEIIFTKENYKVIKK